MSSNIPANHASELEHDPTAPVLRVTRYSRVLLLVFNGGSSVANKEYESVIFSISYIAHIHILINKA
jgi:hypothetical protein